MSLGKPPLDRINNQTPKEEKEQKEVCKAYHSNGNNQSLLNP